MNYGSDERGLGRVEAMMANPVSTKAKMERRSLNMQICKAENGWVVFIQNLVWIAADAAKLCALLEVLAEEFQEKEVTL